VPDAPAKDRPESVSSGSAPGAKDQQRYVEPHHLS
jgi:hypothetical protein